MNRETKKLNTLNNELDKMIHKENDAILTDIVCYLRVANISEYHQEVVRHDLLEMVLSAQERNDAIQTVIGEDYKGFCDDVIASLPSKTRREKLLEVLDIFCLTTSILGAITLILANETFNLVTDILKGNPLNFQISISIFEVGSYFIIIIGAYMLVHVIFGKSFEQKKEVKHNKIKTFLKGTGFMTILLLLAWIGRKSLFTLNILVALPLVVLFYLIHRLLSNAY